MAVYYLDTSALVKLYVRERGTDRMLGLSTNSQIRQLAVLSLAGVELYSAVRRRERAGDIDSDLVAQLLDRFESHLQTRFLRQDVNESVLDLACELINRHPLRAYDALQLAGCLIMKTTTAEPLVFVCADQRLLEVAGSENLTRLDPTA